MWDIVVNQELLSRGIDSMDKLNIRDLADAFELRLYYCNRSTRIIEWEGQKYCIIDTRKPQMLQYEDFLHELAHIIYDKELLVTTNLNRYIYKERKIDYLVPLIAIPKFALSHIHGKTIGEISEEFHVSHELVIRRLEHVKRKLIMKSEVGGWPLLENVKEKMG